MSSTKQLFFLASLAVLSMLTGCAGKTAAPPANEPLLADGQVIEHTVAAGETLDAIADNYYGDPSRAGSIARDNGLTGWSNDGSDSSVQITTGSVLALRFAPAELAEAQRRATALGPYNRGVDLLAQDRLADAQRQFELALATAPGLTAATYNLALVHLNRGQADQALSLLEGLITQRPANHDFAFARGNALFQLARFKEAAEQFELILDDDHDHSRAAFGLARSLQEDGQDRQAVAAWKRYLELDNTSSWAAAARRNLRKLQDGS